MTTIELSKTDQCGENSDEIEYDEIKQYLTARYLCPPEAMWRIYEFRMREISHCVNRLAVHLEHKQQIYFTPGLETEALQKNHETNLTAWFTLNKTEASARQYLYSEIPDHYRWLATEKRWQKRQITTKPLLNRLYFVSPRQQERFYLRLLLLNVRGATSFDDIRTYQGTTYPNYKEAAEARDLIATDDEWDRCLEEAAVFKFPKQMAELFAYILVFQRPTNARQLYEKYKEQFFEPRLSPTQAENQCLNKIKHVVTTHNCTMEEFNLRTIQNICNEIQEIEENTTKIDEQQLINSLNANQKKNIRGHNTCTK